MPASGTAVAAMTAGDVTFAGDPLADFEALDFAADLDDLADKFVADSHGDGNGILAPFVPIVDMDIGAADGRLFDFDQDIIVSGLRFRHILHPDAGLRFGFN